MTKNAYQPSVVVMIAALNEEKGIGPTLAEFRLVLEKSKFLVIDGKSTDKTVEIAKNFGADILSQEGVGKGNAISQGIRFVNSDVKYVVFTDADYTYPAKCVPEMIQILEKSSNVGMVSGNRFNHNFDFRSMKSPFFIGNRLLSWAQQLLNGVHLKDPLTGLRVIRCQILKDWNPRSEGFDIEAEMNHIVERKGYKTIEISIKYRDRLGKKKLKLRHGLTILKRIIIESIHNRIQQ